MRDERLQTVLQVFAIILLFKSISATYYATQYAMQDQLWLIEKYAKITSTIPIFLIVALVLIAIPLLKKIPGRVEKLTDYLALAIIAVSMLFIFI